MGDHLDWSEVKVMPSTGSFALTLVFLFNCCSDSSTAEWTICSLSVLSGRIFEACDEKGFESTRWQNWRTVFQGNNVQFRPYFAELSSPALEPCVRFFSALQAEHGSLKEVEALL